MTPAIPAALDTVASVPREQIPALIAALAARLLVEPEKAARENAEPLIDAKEMAALLKCHESWVRSAARQGKIPFVPVGRYMRFKPSEVQAAIAARNA